MMVVGPMPAFTKAMGRIGRSGAVAAVLEFGGTLDHSVFPRLERGFKVEGFKLHKDFSRHEICLVGTREERRRDKTCYFCGLVDN